MDHLGFCQNWREWIHACICSGSVPILVSGSPMQEVQVGKSLRQRDPLVPFMFLIVAEGLSALMRRAVKIDRFHSFKFVENDCVFLLQYADDTLLIGEANWENLWGP